MPLVDYASSDDDEGSDEEKIISPDERTNMKKKSAISNTNENKNGEKTLSPSIDSDDSVFSALPQPRINPLLLMDDNSLSNLLLNKKQITNKDQKLGKVKISVPSVSDFDDSEPVKKKPKKNVKGSGLFSVLPPPKSSLESSKTLVPQSVSSGQNKKFLDAKTSVIKKYLKKSKENLETSEGDNDDDEMPTGTSFFGSFLNDSNSTNTESKLSTNNFAIESEPLQPAQNNIEPGLTETYQESTQQSDVENSNYYNCGISDNNIPSYSEQLVELPSTENNPLGLDEKAMQILCGRKKTQQQVPMNIIDLSGEEIMPDSKEWLLKQLSQEKKVKSQSHRKSMGPSSQQRRKHQITYLAYQAKEQELELQNQWANNRMSRRQTQSKYGF